jgi:hypothetical protein
VSVDVLPREGTSLDRAAGRLGLLFVALASAIAAALAILMTPLYLGSVLFPITIVFGIATNIVLPILGRELVDSFFAAATPVIVWFIVAMGLGFTPAHGSVLLPGGGGGQTAVSLGLVFGGIVVGSITLARYPGPGLRARRRAVAAAAPVT